MDTQIKLHGYRVELMDIEVHVKRRLMVQEAVCFVIVKNTRQLLVAAVSEKSGKIYDDTLIKNQMAKDIPDYMVPDIFLFLEEFPVNQNGKIDRKKVRDLAINEI